MPSILRLIRTPRGERWAMALLLFAVVAGAWLCGDRMPVAGGLGWDGKVFGGLVLDFDLAAFVDQYRLRRILPSGLLHLLHRGLDLPSDAASAVALFAAFNAVALFAALGLWWRVAAHLHLVQRWRWIGFAGLFLGYANARMPFYYPPLTDTAAFLIGMILFEAWLAGSRWRMLLAGLAGSFTWPLAVPACLALLAWPPRDDSVEVSPSSHLAVVTASVSATAALAGFSLVYFGLGIDAFGYGPVAGVEASLLPLSMLAWAAVLFFIVRALIGSLGPRDLWLFFIDLRAAPWLMMAIIAVLPAALATQLPAQPGVQLGLAKYLAMVLLLPMTRPLISLLALAVYYGPIALLLMMYWRRIAARARAMGPAVLAILAAHLPILAHSESRMLIFVLPFAVGVLCLELQAGPWSVRMDRYFWVLVLVASKIWWPISTGFEAAQARGDELWLGYHMSVGPRMSTSAYMVQAPLVLLALAIFVWLRSQASTPALGGDSVEAMEQSR